MMASWKTVGFLCAVIFCLAQTVFASSLLVGGPHGGGSHAVCNKGRICTKNAACVDGKCQCLPGFYGNGFFYCHSNSDLYYCIVTGDPRLRTFKGAESPIDIPCRHRLTKFYAEDVEYDGFCDFEVYGIIEVVDQGVYYEGEAEFHLSVTDVDGETSSIWITFGQDSGSYKVNYRPIAIDFDKEVEESIPVGKITVTIHYDSIECFFVVHVPSCQTTFKWRPRDPAPEFIRAQIRRPGLGIITKDPYFPDLDPYALWRADLCLSDYEKSTTFQDEIEEYGYLHPSLPVLRRFLDHPDVHLNNRGKFAYQCKESQKTFTDCPKERQLGALNICGPLLSNRPMMDCQLHKSNDFMEAFELCLRGHCLQDVQACDDAEDIFNQCETTDLQCDQYGKK